MRDLSKLLWGDLQTDRERAEFIESGRAVDTGILAQAMVEDLVKVYRRIDAAISRAGQATVFGFEPHSSVRCVFASNLAEVVEILTGNTPTNPEGSP